MMRKTVPAALGIVIAAALLAGCGGQVKISQVVITGVPESGSKPGLNPELLKAEIVSAAEASRGVSITKDARKGGTLKIDLRGLSQRSRRQDEAEGYGSIDLKLQQQNSDGSPETFNVTVELTPAETASMQGGGAERKVAGVVARGLAMIRTEMEFRDFDEHALIKELASKDAWRRGIAVEELGRRKMGQSLSQLLLKLKDPEKPVAMKAVGALVAIGNQAAVPALVDFTRGRDAHTQSQMMYAIAQIGGNVAEGYLFVVSTGHQDYNVASAAAEALAELETRKASRSNADIGTR
ncbi:MAG: HEAT repeat domain-containing protein [Myxococcota bacterium]|jgi:hypothetical protein